MIRMNTPMNRQYLIVAALALVAPLGVVARGAHAVQRPRAFDDLVYVRDSVEWAKACEQVYEWGWKAVQTAAPAQKGDWAIVFDVDETVLSNVEFIWASRSDPDRWTKWPAWVSQRKARAVPGARRFMEHIRPLLGSRGHVVFISNRVQAMRADTIENLRGEGLFVDGDIMLDKAGPADTKDARRSCVEMGKGGPDRRCQGFEPMSVVALFGDSVRDFVGVRGLDAAARMRDTYDPAWGGRYFIVPNPMYGFWQSGYR